VLELQRNPSRVSQGFPLELVHPAPHANAEGNQRGRRYSCEPFQRRQETFSYQSGPQTTSISLPDIYKIIGRLSSLAFAYNKLIFLYNSVFHSKLTGYLLRLANFAKPIIVTPMTTMNISLPDALKSFVDEQVAGRGYGTSSEYVRELIRRDQDRQHLRMLLLAGASSPKGQPTDSAYFDGLRERVHNRKTG
jgi:antitoxin ParD1/3/4